MSIKTTPAQATKNQETENEIKTCIRQAENLLKAALAAMTRANEMAHQLGKAGGGYGYTGDTGHYKHDINELLSADNGEAGLTAYVQIINKK